VSYTYDAADRRATMTVAGQPTVTYDYDNANRLTSVTQATSTVTFTYDDVDRRSTLTLPNGIVTTYGYDNANQLTSLTYTLGQTTLGTLTYTYDLAGRRTEVGGTWARTGLPATMSASHDAANRLTQWAGNGFSYDVNGNLANDGSTSYTWNARDQLMALSGAASATVQYDGARRRRGKTINGQSTQFLYDGDNVVQELFNGVPIANLLMGRGIDELWHRADLAGSFDIVRDALGSTIAEVDPTGALTTQYTYEPFGVTALSGQMTANSTEFAGRESDPTGFYFYRARYYSPAQQRFISEDPIGLKGGINVYAYVGNDPIRYTDPSGLLRDCDAEHISCFNDCYNSPTKCLPWPVGRGGGKSAKASRYLYCQTKCLGEYMECLASNEAEKLAQFCGANPAVCIAAIAAGAAIALQPELAPAVIPVLIR
jgi:RHS repeat-associated protein